MIACPKPQLLHEDSIAPFPWWEWLGKGENSTKDHWVRALAILSTKTIIAIMTPVACVFFLHYLSNSVAAHSDALIFLSG
jgi:hypothetical protein